MDRKEASALSSSQVMYRSATAGDAAAMVAVHHESVRVVPPGHYPETVLAAWSPVPDGERRQWLANLIARRDVVCEVAVLASGAVAGFCLAFPGRSRLQALYVRPSHSSRGIGAGLLRAVEARCRAAGAVTLELNASYNAASFYRANGYVPVGETTQSLTDGTTMGVISMFRPIATVSPSHGRPLFLHGIGQEPSRAIAAACERSEVVAQTVEATLGLYRRKGFTPPWIGYLAEEGASFVGTCGFAGPPAAGQAEIAYFTFPEYEGRGIATAMASELIAVTRCLSSEHALIAHTLPREGPSTSILRKLGFSRVGTIDHPEDGPVWKWREQEIKIVE